MNPFVGYLNDVTHANTALNQVHTFFFHDNFLPIQGALEPCDCCFTVFVLLPAEFSVYLINGSLFSLRDAEHDVHGTDETDGCEDPEYDVQTEVSGQGMEQTELDRN